MRGAGDHHTVGDGIAFYRRRRGRTQWVVAQLVGLPTERSVADQVDIARTSGHVTPDEEALTTLPGAATAGQQIVRDSATVHDTVTLLHRRAPSTVGRGSALLGLAERCRAIQ